MASSEHSAAPPVLADSKYEILSVLGSGGFGTVFKARHTGLNKLVAIKVLHTTLQIDADMRSRFEQEAQAGATLSHPNLVSVFDYGFTEKDEPYIVMEFVDGLTLEQALKTQNLALDDLLNVLIQVAKAVSYLHGSNIVHRDLKTGNILIQTIGGERYAKLLDLGIAKVFSKNDFETSKHLTSTGAIFGSPLFMSPEQGQGYRVDARSDVYSLGCVMYECAAGKPPFDGENPMQVILKHLMEPAPQLPYRTEKEYQFTQAVTKCLEKDPAHRYQSMRELIEALQKIQTIAPNEKAHVRSDSRIRSYVQDAEARSFAESPGSTVGTLIGIAVLTSLCLCAAYVMSSMWKIHPPVQGTYQSEQNVRTEARTTIPPNTPPVAQDSRVAAPGSGQQQGSSPQQLSPTASTPTIPIDSGYAERISNLEKALAEKTAAEKALAEKLAADKASAAPIFMPMGGLTPSELAQSYERASKLAKATTERSQQTEQLQQSWRAMDQSTRVMQNGTASLKQYNDNFARTNGLSR